MTTYTATGREYLRVSKDQSGRARSTDEQHTENLAAAAARGVALGVPYEDRSISASRYSTKVRDDFARLLADLEAGRFQADELWLWESSRGSRKVGEWATLIDVCEAAGVRIHVTTHNRTYDPTNDRDRRSLQEDAVDSEYESGKTSTRLKRAAAANARDGKPHGRAPYGYRRRYDPLTKKMITQEEDPIEGPIVRELFDRIRAGHSLRSIAADFEIRGVRTRTGKIFAPQHLRDLAMTASYAGLRVWDPDRGKSGGAHKPGPDAVIVKGTWDAIVPEATYRAVQRLLSDPRRTTTRPGKAKHLLSKIARCDKCGETITLCIMHGRPYYQCRAGCIKVQQADVDQFAERIVLEYLARPDVTRTLKRAEVDSVELQLVRDELAAVRDRRAALVEEAATGAISISLVGQVEAQLLTKITQLEQREAELTTPAELLGYISPGSDVARRWAGAPMSARREVVRLLLAPDMIGELRVMPTPGGRHVPAEKRVRFRRET